MCPSLPRRLAPGPPNRGEEVRRQISFEQISVLPRKLTALVMVAAVIGAVVATALVFFAKQVHHLF